MDERVVTANTEHVAHHQADDTGDTPAVRDDIVDGGIARVLDIHRHACEQLLGVQARNAALRHHLTECTQQRVVRGAGVDRIELPAQADERRRGRGLGRRRIDRVVDVTAPRVDDRRLVAQAPPEQRAGEREALGVLRDRRARDRRGRSGEDEGGHPAARSSARTRGDARLKSFAISENVAFAPLMTPGTPAPGCVPAPTM